MQALPLGIHFYHKKRGTRMHQPLQFSSVRLYIKCMNLELLEGPERMKEEGLHLSCPSQGRCKTSDLIARYKQACLQKPTLCHAVHRQGHFALTFVSL